MEEVGCQGMAVAVPRLHPGMKRRAAEEDKTGDRHEGVAGGLG